MIQAVRGAIQVAQNSRPAIHQAAARLVREMLDRNAVPETDIVSILFSVTGDLTAANPATGLRELGFADTPLFCCQEPVVDGGMPRVIRVLLTWECARRTRGAPVYLDGAAALRPDPGARPVTDIPSVWHVTREYAGLAEAGGVKDVVRGLAEASVRAGIDTSVVLPRYGFLPDTLTRGRPIAEFLVSLPDHDRGDQFFDEPVQVFSLTEEGVRIFLVESPRYASKRNVYTYTEADHATNEWQKPGTGHWDSHQLNLILQRSTLETILAIDEHPAEVVGALCRPLVGALCRPSSTATTGMPPFSRPLRGNWSDIGHGLPIPALCSRSTTPVRGITRRSGIRASPGCSRASTRPCWQRERSAGPWIRCCSAGSYASVITVSEQYARELLAERGDELSGGLGRAFRERGIELRGVTNGLDPSPWDPRGSAGRSTRALRPVDRGPGGQTRLPERPGLPGGSVAAVGSHAAFRVRRQTDRAEGHRHPSGSVWGACWREIPVCSASYWGRVRQSTSCG